MAESRNAFEDEAREAEEAERVRKTVRAKNLRVTIDGKMVGSIEDWMVSATVRVRNTSEHAIHIPGRQTFSASCRTMLPGHYAPPVHPETPRVVVGEFEWSEAIRFNGDVCCVSCAPPATPIRQVRHIEANEVWDVYPTCVVCHKKHRYVKLDHETCGGCNEDQTECDGTCAKVCRSCGGHPCFCEVP